MKQHRQSHIRIGWLVASAITLASAHTLAADMGVISTGRSVNEVHGRASGTSPGAGIHPVNTTGVPQVSEVYGRGNQMSGASGAAIGIGATDVGDFGRSSSTLAHRGTQDTHDLTVADSR